MYGSGYYNTGEVVQLKSGGAPLTITGKGKIPPTYQVTCVSRGGLMQQFDVPHNAVKKYSGPMTAPCYER